MNVPLVYSHPDQGYLVYVHFPVGGKQDEEDGGSNGYNRERKDRLFPSYGSHPVELYADHGIPMVIDSATDDFIVASASCLAADDCARNTSSEGGVYAICEKSVHDNDNEEENQEKKIQNRTDCSLVARQGVSSGNGYEPSHSPYATYMHSQKMRMLSLKVRVDVYADKPVLPSLRRVNHKKQEKQQQTKRKQGDLHVHWEQLIHPVRVGSAQNMKGTHSNIFGLGTVEWMEFFRQRTYQQRKPKHMHPAITTRTKARTREKTGFRWQNPSCISYHDYENDDKDGFGGSHQRHENLNMNMNNGTSLLSHDNLVDDSSFRRRSPSTVYGITDDASTEEKGEEKDRRLYVRASYPYSGEYSSLSSHSARPEAAGVASSSQTHVSSAPASVSSVSTVTESSSSLSCSSSTLSSYSSVASTVSSGVSLGEALEGQNYAFVNDNARCKSPPDEKSKPSRSPSSSSSAQTHTKKGIYSDVPIPQDSESFWHPTAHYRLDASDSLRHHYSLSRNQRTPWSSKNNAFSSHTNQHAVPQSYVEYTFGEGDMSRYASLMVPHTVNDDTKDKLQHNHYLSFRALSRDTYDEMAQQFKRTRVKEYPHVVIDDVPVRNQTRPRRISKSNINHDDAMEENDGLESTTTSAFRKDSTDNVQDANDRAPPRENALASLFSTYAVEDMVWAIRVGELRDGETGILYIGKRVIPPPSSSTEVFTGKTKKRQPLERSSTVTHIPFPVYLPDNFNYMVAVSNLWINDVPVQGIIPRYCMIDTGALQTHFPPVMLQELQRHLHVTSVGTILRSQNPSFTITIEFEPGIRVRFPIPSRSFDNGVYDRLIVARMKELNNYVQTPENGGPAMIIGLLWIQHMTIQYDLYHQTLGIKQ